MSAETISSVAPVAIPGAIDVWRVDLGRATEDGLAELLCARERARAERIVDARRRARWARSRGILRALLGRYLDADPSELRFGPGAHGKPALESVGGQGSDLRFNLSHSGELMLVAVTSGREVGVDVERERARATAGFLRAWTVREARVKCRGTGLGMASAPASDGGAREEMWTVELDLGPRAFAAVAVAGVDGCELRRRDWSG